MWKTTSGTVAGGCGTPRVTALKHTLPQPFPVGLRSWNRVSVRTTLQVNAVKNEVEQDPVAPVEPAKNLSAVLKSVVLGKKSKLNLQNGRRPLEGLHKPVGLVLFSAHFLGTVAALSDLPGAHYLPVLFGAALGTFFAALNRFCMARLWSVPEKPLRVVITGGTKGLGKALAREFLQHGDHVFITSRDAQSVATTMRQLHGEVTADNLQLCGCECDVSKAANVAHMASTAAAELGGVDIWVNNAGYSGSFQPFLDASDEQIERVLNTNLLGTLLCCQAAICRMQHQPEGGHVFNMDGAGADGLATPQYAAYGSTKAAIAQLMGTLKAELKGTDIGIHTLSPGMMLTELLLEGATDANKQVFNILCEQPETVAAFLVPRIKSVVARGETGSYIKYLTPFSALYRFLTAPSRIGRFFDSEGNIVYPPEHERILGEKAKTTARLADKAARRSSGLAFAYSFSVALAVLFLITEANSVSASM